MKPLPYQIEGVRAIEAFNGRALLADEMGLGKTLQVLLWLKRNPDALPAVVVCPASVKAQWLTTAHAVGLRRVLVLEGRRNKESKACPEELADANVVVINYDILSGWADTLRLKLHPRALVLDEIQYTANLRSYRSKACRELSKSVVQVVGLSGTPMLNKTVEMFNGLNMIRPDVFNSMPAFCERFAKWKWTRYGRMYDGPKNTKKLHALLLETCMIRRLKADVLDQLPDKVRRVVPLEIRDRQEYEYASKEFLKWLAQRGQKKVKKAMRAEAIVKVGYLLRLAAKLKMKATVEWIDGFMEGSDEKLVVFANHLRALDAMERRCAVRPLRIDGGTPQSQRKRIIQDFAEDPDVRLLIGNIRALGTGVDRLQTSCSNVAFAELPWQPGVVLQGEDRVWRMGATGNKVWVWYLVAYNTMEERLCKVLQTKHEGASAVLDGGTNETLDVMDMLLSETN